ncbi:MAG TPA: futalosine hydrolase [Phycisphaerales bacterium]|nr:futalosine hydrolase [Phycisphaerales bacterium]
MVLSVAARREAEAVARGVGGRGSAPGMEWARVDLNDRLSLVLTGVGKANAAGGLARALVAGDSGVVSIGVSGALPGSGLEVGDVLVADSCVLADEGVGVPGGFLAQSEVGFPALAPFGERFPADPAWVAALGPLADRIGGAATISTCAGTDERAAEIAGRTGALAEDMESAAAGLVALRLGLPFACVRVISNRTGARERQAWDLPGALAVLERVARAV